MSQQTSLEAVKLIKDWSTWMTTIQAAVIWFLNGKFDIAQTHPLSKWLLIITIIAFLLNIILGAFVLNGLPYVTIELNDDPDQNIYQMPLYTASPLARFKLWHLTTLQHSLFAIGITTLGAFVTVYYLTRPNPSFNSDPTGTANFHISRL